MHGRGLDYGFPTVMGRGLFGEFRHFVNPPFLIVTMADLWERFRHEFEGAQYRLYLTRSIEQSDLDRDAAALGDVRAIIGLGGGQALDVAKYFAWRRNLPLFQAPTALSVNAVYSHRSGVREDGKVMYRGYAVPECVFIDYDVLRSAPRQGVRLLRRLPLGERVLVPLGRWLHDLVRRARVPADGVSPPAPDEKDAWRCLVQPDGAVKRAEAHRIAASGGVGEAEVPVVALPDRRVRDLEGVVEERLDRHGRPPQASLIEFSSVPSPVISSLTRSPGCSVICGLREKPTPAGVPVAMRSPGESVMMFER